MEEEFELIELEFYMFNHGIKMIQEYRKDKNSGFYKYIVYCGMYKKIILDVGKSSEPYEGKVNQFLAKELYERAIRKKRE